LSTDISNGFSLSLQFWARAALGRSKAQALPQLARKRLVAAQTESMSSSPSGHERGGAKSGKGLEVAKSWFANPSN
jgi:hypothetical protein